MIENILALLGCFAIWCLLILAVNAADSFLQNKQ